MSEPRKVILRILLWSLGLAAISGVLAVLTSSDVITRVMGTGFVTAGTALLMLPVSNAIDRQRTRPVGLCGMACLVVEYVLILALIWELPYPSLFYDLGFTAFVFPTAAVPAIAFLYALFQKGMGLASRVGLLLTGAYFFSLMLGVWLPGRWGREDEWVETGLTFAVLGLLTPLTLAGFSEQNRRHWRWVGVAAATAASVMMVIHIWVGGPSEEEIFSLFVATSCFVGFANAALLVPLSSGQGWLRTATLLAGAATAVFAEMIVFELETGFTERLTSAAAILTGCGSVALLVLARLNRSVDFESLPDEFVNIIVQCPRCRRKGAIDLGGATCSACGLRIEVRIEEPRCKGCGYLLYKLVSDRCPECGRTIEHASS